MMMKQNRSLLRVLCLMLAALLLCGTALAEPRYPDKTADATDAALLLSADMLKDWNELATRVKSATGVRLYLATVDFLDGASLADYGAGLRSKWGLDDDSLLLRGYLRPVWRRKREQKVCTQRTGEAAQYGVSVRVYCAGL